MKNFYDVETLSAYLDGQLDASNAAQIEVRLKTDAELASALRDLRAARGILKKLPARKAPRNFTLTRQMVGLKPPLPRTYPLLRFATAFAAILFLFSFTATTLVPMINFGSAAAPAYGLGSGGGCDACGGGGPESAPMAAAATEAPATELFAAQEASPASTLTTDAADTAPIAETETVRIMETPSAKDSAPETANQAEVQQEPLVSPINWTWIFLVITILGGLVLWIMQFTARNKWR
ncbi:MAG: hypothetical protein U0V18_03920 [Anaerolineales bacterium]